jgi:hypothetical protein
MLKKRKIRKLQEDLKMFTQLALDLSRDCNTYKKKIKELEYKVEKLTIKCASKQSEFLTYHKWYLKNRNNLSNSNPEHTVNEYLRYLNN